MGGGLLQFKGDRWASKGVGTTLEGAGRAMEAAGRVSMAARQASEVDGKVQCNLRGPTRGPYWPTGGSIGQI